MQLAPRAKTSDSLQLSSELLTILANLRMSDPHGQVAYSGTRSTSLAVSAKNVNRATPLESPTRLALRATASRLAINGLKIF